MEKTMIDALRLIAAKSPYAGEEAMKCIRAMQASSPVLQHRYNRVVEIAFGDPNADFTPAERQQIASHIEADNKGAAKTAVVQFRVTTDERDDLRTMAEDAEMDVSEYIRSRIWGSIDPG